MMVEETVKAYIAGIIDADGSIGIYRAGMNYFAKVTVTMAEIEAVDLIHEMYGGTIHVRPQVGDRRVMKVLSLAYNRARIVLEDILPYLRVKRQQAVLAIEVHKTVSKERRRELAEQITKLNRPVQLQRLSEAASMKVDEATVRSPWEHGETSRNDSSPT